MSKITKSRIEKLENQKTGNSKPEIILVLPSTDPERPYCIQDHSGQRFLTKAEYEALPPYFQVVVIQPLDQAESLVVA